MDMTDDEARRELLSVQRSIEEVLRDREVAEQDQADADASLHDLRRRERVLLEQLTPERSGVPRVIRKGGVL